MKRFLIFVFSISFCFAIGNKYSKKIFPNYMSEIDTSLTEFKKAVSVISEDKDEDYAYDILTEYIEDNNKPKLAIPFAKYFEEHFEYLGYRVARFLIEDYYEKFPEDKFSTIYLTLLYEQGFVDYIYEDLKNRFLRERAVNILTDLINIYPESSLTHFHLYRMKKYDYKRQKNLVSNSAQSMSSIDEATSSVLTEEDMSYITNIIKFEILDNAINRQEVTSSYFYEFIDLLKDAKKYSQDKYDGLQYEIIRELLFLYFDNEKYDEGVSFYESLENKSNYKIQLIGGLLYFKQKDYLKASQVFNRALTLMDINKKVDYKINSVLYLLPLEIKEEADGYNLQQKEQLARMFFDMNDPVFATSVNEREIEHFARMAYAEIYFEKYIDYREINDIGWQTDPGKVIVKYGLPVQTARVVNGQLFSGKPGIPYFVLFYENRFFAFEDIANNLRYKFYIPDQNNILRDYLDSSSYFEILKDKVPSEYEYAPKYKFENFSYYIYQNYLPKHAAKELVIAFEFKKPKKELENLELFFENKTNKIRTTFSTADQFKKLYSTVERDSSVYGFFKIILPDTGKSVHRIEVLDKGTNTFIKNIGDYYLKDFNEGYQVSDVVLGISPENIPEIDLYKNKSNKFFPISGNNITENKLSIYYELYNIDFGDEGVVGLEQEIIFEEYTGDDNIFSGFLNLVGLSSSAKDVSITNNFQARQKDELLYFEIDISELENTAYTFTLSIKNTLTGETVERKRVININK